MSEHGLSVEEQIQLRAELEKMSNADLIERVTTTEAKPKVPRVDGYVKNRRHFDWATAARVELFSRLRAPQSSFGKVKS